MIERAIPIRFLKVVLILLVALISASCSSNNRDDNVFLSGKTAFWTSNIEVVFYNSTGNEKYYIGGDFQFKKNYNPQDVNYYISYPSGERHGTSSGKSIRIPKSGGSRLGSIDNIKDFAEDITLKIEWRNEDEETLEETIPLD